MQIAKSPRVKSNLTPDNSFYRNYLNLQVLFIPLCSLIAYATLPNGITTAPAASRAR